MDDEVVLTPEEQLSVYSDRIISSIIQTNDLSAKNRDYLFGQIVPDFFMDENHIIYKSVYNFKEQGIVPDEEFLELWLLRNEKVILESKNNINIDAYSSINENPVIGYASAVIKQFVRLKSGLVEDFDTFKLLIEKYRLEYKAIKYNDVLSQTKVILNDGVSEGRRNIQGYDDAVAFNKSNLAKLEAISDKSVGDGFVGFDDEDEDSNNEMKPIKVADFGDIVELNKHFGGIYTPNFYSFSAPTKGGKSKICTYVSHTAVVDYGQNVLVWAHEGGWRAWKAQMRSVHFNYYYNRNCAPTDVIPGVTQDVIMKNEFKDGRIRELERVSYADLKTNPNYGKITFIDRPFNVETFIDEIKAGLQISKAKILVVDYLQLIGTEKAVSKNERIGTAYQSLLALCKKLNIAVLAPAQFKQEFMDELSKASDVGSVETRLGGGESSEIVRTPDINIAMYASPEDLIQKRMKLLSIPSRLASPFPAFDIYADLSYSYFSSLKRDSVA